jgi:hypothetical protein
MMGHDRDRAAIRDTIIDSLLLRHGVHLRVAYRPFRGQHYIDMRRWHLNGGVWYPDSGLAIRSHDVPWLVRALTTAAECAPGRHDATPTDSPAGGGRG